MRDPMVTEHSESGRRVMPWERPARMDEEAVLAEERRREKMKEIEERILLMEKELESKHGPSVLTSQPEHRVVNISPPLLHLPPPGPSSRGSQQSSDHFAHRRERGDGQEVAMIEDKRPEYSLPPRKQKQSPPTRAMIANPKIQKPMRDTNRSLAKSIPDPSKVLFKVGDGALTKHRERSTSVVEQQSLPSNAEIYQHAPDITRSAIQFDDDEKQTVSMVGVNTIIQVSAGGSSISDTGDRTVLLTGVPLHADLSRIEKQLSRFGKIKEISRIECAKSGKKSDMVKVSFVDEEAVQHVLSFRAMDYEGDTIFAIKYGSRYAQGKIDKFYNQRRRVNAAPATHGADRNAPRTRTSTRRMPPSTRRR